MTNLSPVIRVLEEKCVNCHKCISVCPVKFCIDGSGDKVTIRHDLCIGCGSCITGCSHHAREGIDDTAAFFAALDSGEPFVAVVAPAMVAKLGPQFHRLNGWLRAKGAKAVFDVSFGAELTVKSYLEHIKSASPSLVIAQPCPAIVSYIQIYRPALAPYLAPADSPMLHAIKLLRDSRPDLADCRVAVISPCFAKRREFDETGLGDFNVTIDNFLKALAERGDSLSAYPEEDFDSPPAETAVLFSTPDGLKETVIREEPGLSPSIRKVEGPHTVYPYLRELERSLALGANPLLVDCLNCEKGCNGGTGTVLAELSQDVLEKGVAERQARQRRRLSGGRDDPAKAARAVRKSIAKHWRAGLYDRRYLDRSGSFALKTPEEEEFDAIYLAMAKEREEDFLDCGACGYGSCRMMAIAIFNGLNKAENCHHFQTVSITRSRDRLKELSMRLDDEIALAAETVSSLLAIVPELQTASDSQSSNITESTTVVQGLVASLNRTAELSARAEGDIDGMGSGAKEGEQRMADSQKAIKDSAERVKGIHDMVAAIDKIAARTNLLSMNAAIEAAHAGESGRGFAVVAEEIRKLSEQASASAREIGRTLKELVQGITEASRLSDQASSSVSDILSRVVFASNSLGDIFRTLTAMSSGSSQVDAALGNLGASATSVREMYLSMKSLISDVGKKINNIADISSSNITGGEGEAFG